MRILAVLMLMSLTFAVGCVSASGESGGGGGQSRVLGEPVTLKPGERAVFEADRVNVRFDKVVSDSRCPKNAQCVWAGEAVIRLTVTLPDESNKAIEVKTSATDSAATVGAFHISISDLQPVPTTEGSVRDSDYRVTLIVAKG